MSAPETHDLTGDFWAAMARGVLVRPVCRACGLNFFTPQIACPACLSEDWSYEPSTGRGRVYSATTVHRAPGPDFAVPFELGIVDLDEGWSMLAALAGEPLPPLGAAVEFVPVQRAERTLPGFREVPS